MTRPRLLDLFCGAGGCGEGYHRAGFEVTGVDKEPMPRYPFPFIQADALEYLVLHGHEFDAIHASPPCQAFSAMTKGRWQDREHPDLIGPCREILAEIGKPYVIENVPGAPLMNPFLLCGTMFGLQTADGVQLRRHREFECPWFFELVQPCQHNSGSVIGVYGGGQHPGRRRRPDVTAPDVDFGIKARREAMGIGWMSGKELNQSIPPAYTEFIGVRLIQFLNETEQDKNSS